MKWRRTAWVALIAIGVPVGCLAAIELISRCRKLPESVWVCERRTTFSGGALFRRWEVRASAHGEEVGFTPYLSSQPTGLRVAMFGVEGREWVRSEVFNLVSWDIGPAKLDDYARTSDYETVDAVEWRRFDRCAVQPR